MATFRFTSFVLVAEWLLPVTVCFLFPIFSYFLSLAMSCDTSCLRLLPMLLPVRPLPSTSCVSADVWLLLVCFCFLCYFLSVSAPHHASCHGYFLVVSTTHSVATSCVSWLCVLLQEETDWQWRQAMDYLSAVSELNYMTQIVIMLYEDNDKVGGALLLLPP